MGNKIFVSYKYGDSNVAPLKNWYEEALESTKARDYVTKLQEIIGVEHINKGENDGEDLSHFKDSTIESHLRDKIYDSSVTIVMISPNMKDSYKTEDDQWIPWEISYSLKEISRNGRTSTTNAIFAIVLPDRNNSYSYFLQEKQCFSCSCTTYLTDRLFTILRENMFNSKNKSIKGCSEGKTVYTGEYSYIFSVKWKDFLEYPDQYINRALELQSHIDDYTIRKVV